MFTVPAPAQALAVLLELLEDVDSLVEPLLEFRLHAACPHLVEPLQFMRILLLIHSLSFGNEFFLLVSALLLVGDETLLLKIIRDKFFHAIEIARTIIVLALAVHPVLNSWVTLHAVLAAEVLLLGAVHVDDGDARGGVVLGREFVESWLH